MIERSRAVEQTQLRAEEYAQGAADALGMLPSSAARVSRSLASSARSAFFSSEPSAYWTSSGAVLQNLIFEPAELRSQAIFFREILTDFDRVALKRFLPMFFLTLSSNVSFLI